MRAMDDIVEKFLMEKLEKEIEDVSKTARDLEKIYKCKQIPVHKEWEEVLNLMKQKKPETGAAVKDTIREKLYYLLNLTAEWREQLNKPQLPTPRALLPVDDISGRLKQVKKDLEEPPKGQIEQPCSPKNPQVYRWSCEANLSVIHGFNDKRMIMERLLLNQGTKAIGIVGVAGVGKTALAQLAYNHQRVQQHFLLRIWLCLSKQQKIADCGFGDQVKRMLRCLGFEDQVIEKVGEKKLRAALRKQLNRARGRYLIVLDDVWRIQENEDPDMKLFSFLAQQGTLIVTSRSPELEKMVGPKNMHRLSPLAADDDSCWKIFSDAFMGDIIAPAAAEEMEKQKLEKMEKLKPQIVGKCEGLPLMAKMLGKIGHLQP